MEKEKRSKVKSHIFIGIICILLTVGGLYYFGFKAEKGPYNDLKLKLVGEVLDINAGKILFYKSQYKMLPERLEDINKMNPDIKYFPGDPWGTEIFYARNLGDGTFELRSAGPDKVFDTLDDIGRDY